MNTEYIESDVLYMIQKAARVCADTLNKDFQEILDQFLYERIYEDDDAWFYDNEDWGELLRVVNEADIGKDLANLPDKEFRPYTATSVCKEKLTKAVSEVVERWAKLIPSVITTQIENELYMRDKENFGNIQVIVPYDPETAAQIEKADIPGALVKAVQNTYEHYTKNGFTRAAYTLCWGFDFFSTEFSPDYQKILDSDASNEDKSRAIFKLDTENNFIAVVNGIVNECSDIRKKCVGILGNAASKEFQRYIS